MAELNTKLHCLSNGELEEITVYTTFDEVLEQGIPVKVDGVNGYIKYGDDYDSNASKLNCKLPKDATIYKVHKIASPPNYVILLIKDSDTYNPNTIAPVMTMIKYDIPEDGILYFTLENAPIIDGYEFAVMDGVRYENVKGGDVFTLWYTNTNNYILENLERAYEYCSDNYIYPVPITSPNFGCGNSAIAMFIGAESLLYIPKIYTSHIVNMGGMFAGCTNLTTVSDLDLSSCLEASQMFLGCTNLTTVSDLDLSSCLGTSQMFAQCTNLTTVSDLDLSSCLDASQMFAQCTNLTTITLKNISPFWGVDLLYYDMEYLLNNLKPYLGLQEEQKLIINGIDAILINVTESNNDFYSNNSSYSREYYGGFYNESRFLKQGLVPPLVDNSDTGQISESNIFSKELNDDFLGIVTIKEKYNRDSPITYLFLLNKDGKYTYNSAFQLQIVNKSRPSSNSTELAYIGTEAKDGYIICSYCINNANHYYEEVPFDKDDGQALIRYKYVGEIF